MRKNPFAIVSVILFLCLAVVIGFLNYYYNRSMNFMCGGDYMARRTFTDGLRMVLDVKITVILDGKGKGVILQQGELLNGKETYIIDREINMSYAKLIDNGIYAVKAEKMSKRKSDNAPDFEASLFPILGETLRTMYINITLINGQAYLFNELSSPYFLCGKY